MSTLALTPNKTALVVIDLQKGIVGMPTLPLNSQTVVGNAARLARACRQAGVLVMLVRVTRSADGGDALHPITDAQVTATGKPPADWAEIVPEMGPEPGDHVITKRQWGAFYGTELDLQLRRRGIDTIILCGIATNMGVESTARAAYEHGYNQVFVADAMSARSAAGHQASVEEVFPKIGRVRNTDEVIAALG